MGTAGHIDHGKTTLVKALTGIDCDRLKEEKKRGITIELGFAFMELPGVAERLGVVDVPGHERFVKNMVAGAAGIDFVLLVVAADDGVMEQTREHLEICQLLGIDEGLVALTKIDAVDEELLELVQEDVAEFTAGTFLEDAPIIPVSSHTGEGVAELLAALAAMADRVDHAKRSDLFRLPVDRVFTMKGHGTVVTGTLVSGRVGIGEDVTIYPGRRTAKARSLQVHSASAEQALAGQRTAVNLAGVEVEEVERGDVVGHPGTLFPAESWDVELSLLASAPRALGHRKEVHFHHGTREVLARVFLLDRDELKPGETAPVQIRFPRPMVGIKDDRVVIRSFSPLRTIGGGRLLNPFGGRRRRFGEDQKSLETLARADANQAVAIQLDMAGRHGLTLAQLKVAANLEARALDKVLADLQGKQLAFIFDKEERAYVSGKATEEMLASIVEFMAAYHATHPMKPGATRSELASTWARELRPKLLHFVIERAIKLGLLAQDDDHVRLPEHRVSLAADQEQLKESILAAYAAGESTPPNLKDVLAELDVSQKEAAGVLKLLVDEGRLVRLSGDMYYHAEALAGLVGAVRTALAERGEMGAPEFKELTGLSRKYLIPVLEYLDKAKVTVRVGDVRRLRSS
jgi:selenocysteine-specific elongation factor